MTIARHLKLLGLARSSWYHAPVGETDENLALMKRIDEQDLQTPYYGSRKSIERFRRSLADDSPN